MTKKYTSKELELADKLLGVIKKNLPSVSINGGSISAEYKGKIGKATTRQKVVGEKMAYFR